jgi:diphosphomevalonate decarboxylase
MKIDLKLCPIPGPHVAFANANIALVKYWGKNPGPLNIPIVPSISFTLEGLGTFTGVQKSHDNADHLEILGQETDTESEARVRNFLDYFRATFKVTTYFQVTSHNTIPFKAGLASSASAYASLSKALDNFCGFNLNHHQLSLLARVGSGSAARSLAGGLVGLNGGVGLSHEMAAAFPISLKQADWQMLIVIIASGPKEISSREAMVSTAKTSPLFMAFVDSSHDDFVKAQSAIAAKDLPITGEIMEHSTLKMHASMWAARPAINYWRPQTLQVMDTVKSFRAEHGPVAYFTMDAGPNVKILCESAKAATLKDLVTKLYPTATVLTSALGGPATIIERPSL